MNEYEQHDNFTVSNKNYEYYKSNYAVIYQDFFYFIPNKTEHNELRQKINNYLKDLSESNINNFILLLSYLFFSNFYELINDNNTTQNKLFILYLAMINLSNSKKLRKKKPFMNLKELMYFFMLLKMMRKLKIVQME